nr:unnamed protein product [Callosobruchus analis]
MYVTSLLHIQPLSIFDFVRYSIVLGFVLQETEELERKKQDLQDELQQLRQLKDQLEYILEAHQADCRMQDRSPPDVKPFNNNIYAADDDKFDQVIGGPLTTPSTGMMFNFESLMGGGTGLTPVNAPLAPSSCGTQQRNHVPVSMADLSSPDAGGPPKLVSL